MTYAEYLDNAVPRWPDRVALHFDDDSWSYRRLHDAVRAAAARLAIAGVGEGTHVLLLVENCPEYLIAQFALARLGAVFVTPNPYWTDTEVEHAAQATDSRAAVYGPRFAEFASGLDVAVPVGELLAATAVDGVTGTRRQPDSPLYIPFSSGTTGLPKGVVHTDASLCGGVEQLRHHLRLTKDDRLQVALPLCHIFGATMSAAAISVGAELTLFQRFDLDESLRHIQQAGVTVWPMAGTVAHQLAGRTDLDPSMFASLRFFMWGGSAVPAELAGTITERTGVGFLCSYGMTEAMLVAFNPVERPSVWRLDSPGYATHGTTLRLGISGELEVRGPSVAVGYAGADSGAFSDDGWFRTGDLARIDPDGRLWIVDRIKDMLKVSGFQVAPAQVEMVLREHPAVADACVVGRPDSRTGEAAVAFVVAHSGSLTADDLNSWAATRLATYKLPREYRFVPALPRTPAGKLQRSKLRALAQ